MYFERKELIQSLDLLCFILFVYVWLLDGRTLWLVIKAGLQVQFCNPTQMHPTWSLPFFAVFLCCFNALVAFMHLIGPAVGSTKSKSILIDFVGQQDHPSKLHTICIDALVCFVQLMLTIVAFEHGKDEFKADDEPSNLDEGPLDAGLDEQDGDGQGWTARDEEARLFGLDQDEERRSKPNSLTHPIAVIRIAELWQDVKQRKFSETEGAQASDDTSSMPNTSGATDTASTIGPDRPDTSRLRRFSRRPRAPVAATASNSDQLNRHPSSPPDNSSASVDDSWPPMWLVIARNMVGTQSRLPTIRPFQAFTSLRDGFTNRFGRMQSNSNTDRAAYTPLSQDSTQ